MNEYWSRQIVTKLECDNCGGALRKRGAAPIGGGFIANYQCIRCTETGRVKDRRGNRTLIGSIREAT